ncbi:hypothetical protein [Lactiplantibacillus plantarum]|uniref:hypothetical protein n=1 Tax=Lactiplantibacillus plantarum TaxID=1590 RepID=UPI0008FD1DFC|nr:hypothetical protein [Lactiplantibacillus plantarum]APD00782.1 hypothetical protein ASV54_05315 [Lactiplantibacillus plantarum]
MNFNWKYALVNNIDFYPFFIVLALEETYPKSIFEDSLWTLPVIFIFSLIAHFTLYRPAIKSNPSLDQNRYTSSLTSWLVTIIGGIGIIFAVFYYHFHSPLIWIALLALVLLRDAFANNNL